MFYSKNLNKIHNIKHCFYSRKNGFSEGIYQGLNCGFGSNDKKINVQKNLNLVSKQFGVKNDKLILMNQTHSNKVQIIENKNNFNKINSDAILSKDNSLALCVLTADCAPILIYEKKKNIIGCIHAGGKGAFRGIIENTLKKINEIGGDVKNLTVCIGPCISQKNYEVGEDFYLKFMEKSKNHEPFFSKNQNNSFNFDLRAFVIKKFSNSGVSEIDNINIDSFSMETEYFSHRRAKKLGENDYGRCISVIKKII